MKSKNIINSNKALLSLVFFILLYFTIYIVYIYPLSRLQDMQTTEWATNIIKNTVLGVKDKSYLYKIKNSKIDNISFYYNYFFFHTRKYTIYILFNLNNHYSNDIILNVYVYNFDKNTTEVNQTMLDFNDLQTSAHGDIIHITCGEHYVQKLNMVTNKMTIEINMSSVQLSFELDIDDYTTNMPTFLPRYDDIKDIVQPYFPITSTPGEWCTDNPMIGKIIKGSLNQDTIENGNFWHDNFLGVNDYFLGSYVWYIVLNDDWLIYTLWFGEYERQDKTGCFIIKHRKTNKVIRAGFDNSVVPLPFRLANNLFDPLNFNYTSNKPIGTLNYDSFNSHFKTNEISIKFESIPNECQRVFLYDYYNNGVRNPKQDIVNNYKYAEYITKINVEIIYNGKKESFQERCIVDSIFKYDKNLPDSF